MSKIHMRFLSLMLVIFLLLSGCNGPSGAADSSNARGDVKISQIGLNPGDSMAFNELLMELFSDAVTEDSVSFHYVLEHPENYGISMDEVTLGDALLPTEDDLDESRELLKELKSFDYKNLSENQQLIYDILMGNVTAALEGYDYALYETLFSPTIGVQTQLPITMSEYAFRSEDDVNDYIALLKDVKRYYGQLLNIEKEKSRQGLFMADFTVDAIVSQCEAFIKDPENNMLLEIFEEKLTQELPDLTDAQKQEYIQKNKDVVMNDVIPAYKEIIQVLTGLKGTGKNDGGLAGFDKGKEYYTHLVQGNTGSSRSVDEMIEMVDKSISQDLTLIGLLYSKDAELFTKMTEVMPPETEPVKILQSLQKAILNEFPQPVSDVFNVKSVHESIGENASPAFYMLPALDATDSNTIYINSYYGRNDDPVYLYTTLAHEGYPGHLYQNTYFYSTNPHPIRKLIANTGYAEGWATYVEQLSYQYLTDDINVANALAANQEFSLALSTRIDMGVNYEGWTRDDTLDYLNQFNIGDEDTADAIFDAVVAEPGNYLSYYVGYLEFQELRKTAQKRLGDSFDPVAYHEFLLNLGPAPFDLIRDRMESWIHDYSQLDRDRTPEAA